MRALVTGATGKVGHAVARALLARGYDVRSLVRDPDRANVPDGVERARGDVTDPQSLERAAAGRELAPALPAAAAKGLAGVGEALSRVIRRPPLLSRGQLYFFMWNSAPDASKARRELRWEPTPLPEGLRLTLDV